MDIKVKPNYKCCEKCSNNPANNPHASGICCCTLPYMETFQTAEPVQTTTSTTYTYPVQTTTSTTYTYVKEGNKWVSKDTLKRE